MHIVYLSIWFVNIIYIIYFAAGFLIRYFLHKSCIILLRKIFLNVLLCCCMRVSSFIHLFIAKIEFFFWMRFFIYNDITLIWLSYVIEIQIKLSWDIHLSTSIRISSEYKFIMIHAKHTVQNAYFYFQFTLFTRVRTMTIMIVNHF